MTEEEKKKFLATAGAVVAFVAAIAFGGYKLHHVRSATLDTTSCAMHVTCTTLQHGQPAQGNICTLHGR